MTLFRKLMSVSLHLGEAGGHSALGQGVPGPDLHERYAALAQHAPPIPHEPTPHRNLHMGFRRGGFPTLSAALDYAAEGVTGLNFFDARGKLLHVLSYSRLRLEAQHFARRLIDAGVAAGERLMLVADTSPEFCIAFFGAQYAGVVPVPVATPVGFGAKAGYVEQLRRQILAADAIGLLAPDELLPAAQLAAKGTTARLIGSPTGFRHAPASNAALRPFGAQDACYVQFSSGSTRTPHGVDIRQDRLMANIDASLEAQQIGETDGGVSWLPLYHDMGLIGFVLAPMCAQRTVDLMSPHDFARRPLQWLTLISRRRASITYSPSFGYDLVVRRAATQAPPDLDLSCLRLAGIGADMIQPAILERFAEAFAPNGFDRRAFLPSYGMAEVCVGLSFGAPLGGMKLDTFADPATGRARSFVVCGRVIEGHKVEIRDNESRVLEQRQIGRLFVRGPSVMPGYFRESASPLHDGWLDTGDLGYWCGDELVITGRAKDLIIVNGRNIWPQDIEWAVEALPQVRRGNSCAFSVDGGESEKVIVMVESRPEDELSRDALQSEVRQAVKEAVGVEAEIVLVGRAPGLPRTSSGKLSRMRARGQYIAASLDHSQITAMNISPAKEGEK